MNRLVNNILSFVLLINGPWWLFFASLIFFRAVIRQPYEIVAYGILYDIVYGVPFEGPLHFNLWGTVVSLIIFFLGKAVISNIRSYGQ